MFRRFHQSDLTEDSRQPAYRLSPDVTAAIHDQGLVLLHATNNTVLTSNHVGARIWQGLQAGQALDAIAAAISREFRVTEPTVKADAAGFIRELQAEGLLLVTGGAA